MWKIFEKIRNSHEESAEELLERLEKLKDSRPEEFEEMSSEWQVLQGELETDPEKAMEHLRDFLDRIETDLRQKGE
jgi:DNA-binding ferritin-like protein